MQTPPSPPSDLTACSCKMEIADITGTQRKHDHVEVTGKLQYHLPSSDVMSTTALNDLRSLTKSSFGIKLLPSSPVQKGHHHRKTKSAQLKIETDDIGSNSAVSRVSSASLDFSLSFTGFPGTDADTIACKDASRDNETQLEQEEGNQKVPVEATLPIYLMFTGLKYKVIVKGLRINTEKEILNKISGSASPGEMLALMGPSGSGKTTLLNLLGGRISSKLVEGSITYNNQSYSKSLKRRIGFVTQDDVLFAHLTVKETLTYSALLRLPKTMTKKEKEKRAMDVIYRLGLERCQDTIIGGSFLRGISGGERKRVCIGNEVIINPSMLFLDEPTSGLDSTTALRIVQMLHDIAEAGKTVITTIHQPSSRMFYKFDKLILLGKGNLLYFGKASDVMTYFSSIGCSPLLAMNPAEFLLDLANGNLAGISIPCKLQDKMKETVKNGRHQKPSPTDVHEYLVEAYETLVADGDKKSTVVAFSTNQDTTVEISASERHWGASWWEQFSILFWRGLKERRHEYLSSMRITQVLATAIIIGLLWWHSDSTTPKGLQDQAGLLFFISVFWGFFPVVIAIFTFPQERAMLNKERSVDMYRMSSYFMARTLGDMPLDLFLPIIFLAIVYFMANLKLLLAPFFLSMLVVFLSILAAQGLGLAIGAIVMDIKKATTLASITVMTFMLAGGFFVKRVPVFISWIQQLSFTYHTYRLLLKVQYGQVPQYLNKLDSQVVVKDVTAMIAMAIGYRFLAYIALRRMKLKS